MNTRFINSDIAKFISRGNIVRYLGVTPVALSKIKKRIED